MRSITRLSLVLLLALSRVAHADSFKLLSDDIHEGQRLHNEQVYQGFGCHGGNLSPALSWQGAPEGTQSFAVTVFDPDAPGGHGWWHWTLVNIPSTVNHLAKGVSKQRGTLPPGAVEGKTDFEQTGFGGACPPVGDQPHRYQFTVWALQKTMIDIHEQNDGASVNKMLEANAIAKASITAIYGR